MNDISTHIDPANRQFETALRIVESTSRSLFLTGKAGTGKTTFLKRLKDLTQKRMVVLAPTGIAAINAGGMTIHSFFHFPLAPFVPSQGFPAGVRRFNRFNKDKIKMIKTLDLLVIDEVSMVRADILDAIDATLRRYRDHSRPFGGVQLLLIGDLRQLSPVVKPDEWNLLHEHYETPYFFSSQALGRIDYFTVELQHVYRQTDIHFLDILGKIRSGEISDELLSEINRRFIPGFVPEPDKEYVRLTTHNHQAEQINQREMDALPGKEFCYTAAIKGDFPEMSYPTAPTLILKENAQIMFLRNDSEKGFYNGMTGRVVGLSENSVTIRPAGSTTDITVETSVWETSKYTLDSQTGEIKEEVVGMFKQLPLKPAWAITIHKSQGLTFDRAIIDASTSFAHGQTYVALSRCRTLEGIVLERPITAAAIITDPVVERFSSEQSLKNPDPSKLDEYINENMFESLDAMFSFKQIRSEFNDLHRIESEYLYRDYPLLLNKYGEEDATLSGLEKVSASFARQYRSIQPSDPLLYDRIKKGCTYFSENIAGLIALIDETPSQTDNKAVSARLDAALTAIREDIHVKKAILDLFKTTIFSTEGYLKAKSKATIDTDKVTSKKSKRKKDRHSVIPSDVINKDLYQALINWRRAEMEESQVPAFVIAPNRSLIWIAANLPRTIQELSETPGIGRKKIESYGSTLLSIVEDYINTQA